jgi:hypothetical protein
MYKKNKNKYKIGFGREKGWESVRGVLMLTAAANTASRSVRPLDTAHCRAVRPRNGLVASMRGWASNSSSCTQQVSVEEDHDFACTTAART